MVLLFGMGLVDLVLRISPGERMKVMRDDGFF